MENEKKLIVEDVKDMSASTIREINKAINESMGYLEVEQTVSDGTRSILICSINDEMGNRRYVNLPVFNSIYTAQEWARRDLYQR